MINIAFAIYPTSAHTHCLIDLLKNRRGQSLKPWDANYTHFLLSGKEYFNFLTFPIFYVEQKHRLTLYVKKPRVQGTRGLVLGA